MLLMLTSGGFRMNFCPIIFTLTRTLNVHKTSNLPWSLFNRKTLIMLDIQSFVASDESENSPGGYFKVIKFLVSLMESDRKS